MRPHGEEFVGRVAGLEPAPTGVTFRHSTY